MAAANTGKHNAYGQVPSIGITPSFFIKAQIVVKYKYKNYGTKTN